jgi:hypothetical protein
MLASFLVGYFSRALLSRVALSCDRHVVVVELLAAQASMPTATAGTLAGHVRKLPVLAQASGPRLDSSSSCSGRGWLEALTGSSVDWDITAPPYDGAVLPEADGDKRARSNLTISCPQ